jgi:PAS domain S-box-containing protein
MSEDQTFRDLLEAAPDGILVVADDGNVVLANARALALSGYSYADLVGKPVEQLLPAAKRAAHTKMRGSYFADPHMRPMGVGLDLTCQSADGRSIPVEISLSPFQYGGCRCAIAIVRDVTEARRIDRDLQRTVAELERSNQELERFAYVASHDLQEPLRMVSGYVQLLKRRSAGKVDAEGVEYIAFAVDGVKRMQILINDLLTYSRVTAKPQTLADVPLDAVRDLALANLAAAVAETGAVVTSDPLPTVRGDRVQLVQLLQNLIGNAIKFHAAGEKPEVHISAKTDGGVCQLSVRDYGIGIDPQYAEKIFVIFQRLHSREASPGTGIGLALCKRIAERHGGRIWFEPAPGRGTIFHVRLGNQEPK